MGDRILRLVAQQLANTVQGEGTVARIGGDEFFVLAVDIGSENEAFGLAKQLLDLFSTMSDIPDGIALGASIGMCIFPYQGMTVPDIIRRADESMYRVKNAGKGNYALAEI